MAPTAVSSPLRSTHGGTAVLLVLGPQPVPLGLSELGSEVAALGWTVRLCPPDLPRVAQLVGELAIVAVLWRGDPAGAGVRRLCEMLTRMGRGNLPVVVVSPSRPIDSDAVIGAVQAAAAGSQRARAIEVREPGPVSVDRLEEILAIEQALRRVDSEHPAPCLVLVDIAERALIRRRLGAGALAAAQRRVSEWAGAGASSWEVQSIDSVGRLLILVRHRDISWVEQRLDDVVAALAGRQLDLGDERVHLTPVIGWASAGLGDRVESLEARVWTATDVAREQLDTRPVRWTHQLTLPPRTRSVTLVPGLQTVLHVLATALLSIAVPFAVLVVSDLAGHPISGVVHLIVTAVLAITALSVWAEGFASLRAARLPAPSGQPPPPATAVIAAYLPNEAATVLDTVRAFLRMSYPGLTVMLAYNRERRLPVEDALEALAARDPRLVLLHVPGSTSKAQNVNAALVEISDEMVGIFDADHHPDATSFHRAWRWIAAGYDVVQGRCAVRNGTASMVARTVAVEFESIYGVSHPGRARLHGFAVFGGSNGFWRTSTLRAVRMRGSMLTEDIDASIRVVGAGGRIAYDPGIVSRELAPTTLQHLWRQRLRWAQGWFQVSRRYRREIWNAFELNRRQRLGMTFLLRWREMVPWVGQWVVPLIGYELWRAGGDVSEVPRTWVTGLVALAALASVPGQAVFAWINATPAVRRRPSWFLWYLVFGAAFYGEWRNLVSRVAHVRELLGAHEWVVTPRRNR